MDLSLSILGYANKLDESKKTVQEILASGIKYLHIDIMRHTLVGREAFTLDEIAEVCKWHDNLDIHIMARNPKDRMDDIVNTVISSVPEYNKPQSFVTLSLEGHMGGGYVKHGRLSTALSRLRQEGFRTGIAIEPDTGLQYLQPFLNNVDMILIMSVQSGAGGQKFRENSVNKIVSSGDYGKIIAVDGGINESTIPLVKEANIAVVGSYITSAESPIANAREILKYCK
jgi:ribulose-phosphate 3-epimerase